MSDKHHGEGELKRGLQNRHIQLIALGGSVGTGLFLGSTFTIGLAGPSVILGYAIGGLIAFLIMRQLGEMVTEEPVAGSFAHFAYKYWGDFPGFLAGWNYWILYILVSISEMTASAAFMSYWFPGVPTVVWVIVFFVLINGINMASVKLYGEMEFWFAIIKIAAIVAMILIGGYILFLHPEMVPGATVKNLWMAPAEGIAITAPSGTATSGFFPMGLGGLIIALPIIMFSFGGLELLGITAAEADNPQKVIPKAVNQVIYRILIFYIGTFFVLLSLRHWAALDPTSSSPFTFIFKTIGFPAVAGVLNFVLLTAALSVYNSCVYANSRMLYALALQGNAPKAFTTVDKRGVPMKAQAVAALLTFAVVPLNYFIPAWQQAMKAAMAIVVSALLLNWFMISLAHLKFRATKDRENHKTIFPTIAYPAGNYFVLLCVTAILGIMCMPQLGMWLQVVLIPIWIVAVYIGYKVLKKQPSAA